MNAIVVYESVYGNTRAVAEAIADGLGGAPIMTPAEMVTSPSWPDLLVVGGPTHAHGMASARSRQAALEAAQDGSAVTATATEPALRDWLAELPDMPGARAAAFDTRVSKSRWLTGAASHGIARRLRHHGYQVVDAASFLVSESEGPLVEGELDRARGWAADLAASVSTAGADAEMGP